MSYLSSIGFKFHKIDFCLLQLVAKCTKISVHKKNQRYTRQNTHNIVKDKFSGKTLGKRAKFWTQWKRWRVSLPITIPSISVKNREKASTLIFLPKDSTNSRAVFCLKE